MLRKGEIEPGGRGMRAKFYCPLVLVIAVLAAGCGAPEPPMACLDGDFPWWDFDADNHPWDYTFEYCEAFDMVCNDAVTLAEECPVFLAELIAYLEDRIFPILSRWLDFLPWLDVDEMLTWIVDALQGACGYIDILDRVGTCQPLGEEGAPCAEDADCLEGIPCLEGVCGGVPAAP